MRLHFAILFCVLASVTTSQQIYQSENFTIHLKADSAFIYYPNEVSLKHLVAGAMVVKSDSLILTTHRGEGETAIFAIFNIGERQLNLLYAQKEFKGFLAKQLYLQQELYANGKVKHIYYWEDKASGDFADYHFSSEGYILAVENYKNNALEGKQLYFYPSRQSALQKELVYKDGVLDGMAYYYETTKEDPAKISLVVKEKYKKGKLKKTKTLAVPLVFYMRHFLPLG